MEPILQPKRLLLPYTRLISAADVCLTIDLPLYGIFDAYRRSAFRCNRCRSVFVNKNIVVRYPALRRKPPSRSSVN